MRVRAILNPRAGLAAGAARQVLEEGRPGWRDYAVYMTREPGHATELAREAVGAGADVVLAVGGDGTVNEVAQGVIGSRAALGIVPVGSGNGLARALGIPLRPRQALAALEMAVPRPMDVGFLNGRPFLNVAGLGFDAAVSQSFHERGRRGARRGFLGYLRIGLSRLRAYVPPAVELELPAGVRHSLSPFALSFANGPQYGSGAILNPGGRLDDGVLEVVSFDASTLLRTLAAAPRLFLGGIERLTAYRRFSAACATVTAAEPLPVHLDGDPGPPAARIEVRLQPSALVVLVPQATLAASTAPIGGRYAASVGAGVPLV